MRAGFVVGVLVLSGCAYNSGVQTLGPDTYSIVVEASPARGGQAGAHRIAVEHATEKCTALGREILVDNVSRGTGGIMPGNGSAALTFKCLEKGDPALQRRS